MRVALAVIALAFCATVVCGATPWEQYLNLPRPENAARVTTLTYSPENPRGQLSAGDLQILQNQLFAQDAEAFQLAVRLYRSSDGANAEELGALVGHSVRAHPDFFLRQVARLHIPCSQLSWPLHATGLEYVDRPEASTYESAMRRKALLSVRSKELRRVRDECLRTLQE